jgi:prophage tail gpP-like protein
MSDVGPLGGSGAPAPGDRSPAAATIPDPTEVAVIIVDGTEITNWKTVSVRHVWAEPFGTFEFSTAEAVPAPLTYLSAMPNIGDSVTVYLAGQLAAVGWVITRQSAMDARSHAVRIIGKSESWAMAKSTANPTRNMNFDGQSLEQVATYLSGQVGVNVRVIGALDSTPFERCQIAPGEPMFDFIEHHARMRAAIIGCDEYGNFLLIALHTDINNGDAFIEGRNIEAIDVIWSNEFVYQSLWAEGQQVGNDEHWGSKSSEILASASGPDPNPSQINTPVEVPDTPAEITQRAQFEARWHTGTMLTVTVKVAGWTRGDGTLWQVGNLYAVNSPTHLLNNFYLKAKTVTFDQSDDGGTSTTLELVLPWLLNGNFFQEDVPAAPVPGVSISPAG